MAPLKDADTTADRYPYPARIDGQTNYIRNGVKVAIEAYNDGVGPDTKYGMQPRLATG